MKILKQNQKIDENRLYDLVLKYLETVVLSPLSQEVIKRLAFTRANFFMHRIFIFRKKNFCRSKKIKCFATINFY